MSNTVRAFIALDLNDAIKAELTQLQSQLKTANADVKWVKPASMHLTLKFLGNITEGQAGQIKAALDNIAQKHTPFEISLFKIGAFPKLDNPRVVWVGIDKNCSTVETIAKEIEDNLADLGFKKDDRPFASHLTLGRLRSLKNKNALVEKLKAPDFTPSAASTIDHITIYQSTLTPQGPIYTPLHTPSLSRLPGDSDRSAGSRQEE